jgi:hypothetical protein
MNLIISKIAVNMASCMPKKNVTSAILNVKDNQSLMGKNPMINIWKKIPNYF